MENTYTIDNFLVANCIKMCNLGRGGQNPAHGVPYVCVPTCQYKSSSTG